MIATAHALVAGAIASRVQNPYLAASLTLSSHFVMDSIPHWDFGTNWRSRPKWVTGAISIAETLLGITVAYFLFRQKVPAPILLTMIAISILPDWLETPYYIFFARRNKSGPAKNAPFLEKLTYRIYKIENKYNTKTTPIVGTITTILTVIFFVLLCR